MQDPWKRPVEELSGKIFLPEEALADPDSHQDMLIGAFLDFFNLMKGRESESSYRLPESASEAMEVLEYWHLVGDGGHAFYFLSRRDEPERWLVAARGLQHSGADDYLTNFSEAVGLAEDLLTAQDMTDEINGEAELEELGIVMRRFDNRFFALDLEPDTALEPIIARWIARSPDTVSVPEAKLPYFLDRLAGLQY